MYKRDGDRTFAHPLMPHASHFFCLHIHNRGTNQLAEYNFDREVAEEMLRLREQHGLPSLALCPDQALDTYWGNPSTTHTLLAD